MLFIGQHLQSVASVLPLQAGVWMLPAVLASALGVLASPMLARRVRPAHPIAIGLQMAACGALVLTRLGPGAGRAGAAGGGARRLEPGRRAAGQFSWTWRMARRRPTKPARRLSCRTPARSTHMPGGWPCSAARARRSVYRLGVGGTSDDDGSLGAAWD
jgi:hypothetical protein